VTLASIFVIMMDRDYDVVIYGATGFVGSRAAEYLASQAQREKLRWAIGGRDRRKLETIKARLTGADAVDVLTVDSADQSAVDAMVARARVLLNVAGPFARYGNGIVDACVRLRTHYVDITGETVWVKSLIDRFHDRAAAAGTRVIPFCGFDSVPSDLGSYLLVRHLQHAFGVETQAVKAYFQMYGGFNGGTVATDINARESGATARGRDPFLLNPSQAHSQVEIDRNLDPTGVAYDREIATWVGPFVMGAINTRVVRRSAGLYAQWEQPYGPDFHYQEYTKFDPPGARGKAALVTGLMALYNSAMERAPTRRLLKALLPKPGSGPSEQTMNAGWFTTELLGLAVNGRKARARIHCQGDPSNRATVRFVCESALSLALNVDALPGGQTRGGVLTPATGLGQVLSARLRNAGVTIELALD
jgi:short subunit dehydrogenase-like uncharacterized protein